MAKPTFAQEKPAHNAHWAYSVPNGPSHWSDLESDFAACESGKHQSPIDITNARRDSVLPRIQFDYKPSPLRIINNGHTIRVNYAPGSSITFDGKTLPLTQFHFHRPSEEEIAGKKFDMVIHLVHEGSGGAAAVAVLVKSGGENPAIQSSGPICRKRRARKRMSQTSRSTPPICFPPIGTTTHSTDRSQRPRAPRALNGLC